MARPKKDKKEETFEEIIREARHVIHPITDHFGNGDLNILKEKINEIIVKINS